MITTVNPATGRPLETYAYTAPEDLDRVLDSALAAVSDEDRVKALRRLANLLRNRAAEHALLITTEMGKPLRESLAEIEKCAFACDYYADRLPALRTPRQVPVPPDTARVEITPLGVVLAIMPWNYPFWQVIRSMVPVVAIGGAVVLKHADNVSGCARAVQGLFDEAFGTGTLSSVRLPPDRIGALIDDPRVAAVAFTGSNKVGALVGARAGAAVKKTVLELGGSDPFLVLSDADIPAAAAAAVRSRFLNTGQSCIAAKRLIVHQDVADEFIDAVVAGVEGLVVGDPADPGTDLGPMARADLRDELHQQLTTAVGAGARLLTGGRPDSRPGAWFQPTVIEVPDPGDITFREETFGPLGAILRVPTDAEAIAVANASRYGLSGSVWTADPGRAEAVTAQLRVGSVFVNRISESDPRLPVGGVKASGHGRELGTAGVLEFANLKTIRAA
ncbi:succinate-semialdehyde dehydrogenase / glutarate-semialdehyde dehydrogenase [Amycolatopsis xylanica]|uniref:Succinate-semialdehyde dehydrogenase / glutarate-semialdehyde dehydrogenase n=1 Tax=Amycolatopsis xylanica TaxID=589385 RepID=A0A1H2SME8_9PSEU|nr:aldehyde dehydrogenase family protein [Amycolatopsis xylanica]SDW32801.1 succinate-semialdehyde dehydrogenase / glutarate-semialdehyde dehydrogenase [Amycolatopsis xylanica]